MQHALVVNCSRSTREIEFYEQRKWGWLLFYTIFKKTSQCPKFKLLRFTNKALSNQGPNNHFQFFYVHFFLLGRNTSLATTKRPKYLYEISKFQFRSSRQHKAKNKCSKMGKRKASLEQQQFLSQVRTNQPQENTLAWNFSWLRVAVGDGVCIQGSGFIERKLEELISVLPNS